MVTGYKPKHVVLQEIMMIMSTHDPMSLGPSPEEYESEALSVLSRFNEAVLQLCDDPIVRAKTAEDIVRSAFAFWFGSPLEDLQAMANQVLSTYLASYPSSVRVNTDATSDRLNT